MTLNGVRLDGGGSFDFAGGSVAALDPGERFVVVGSRPAFAALRRGARGG